MKLLNHTLTYLSVAFFLVIGIWAAILYFNMLDEIYDSIDDGLENLKTLIIEKTRRDSTIIHTTDFRESNYAIREILPGQAHVARDVYLDSTRYLVNEDDYEPVRVLKTAFRAHGKSYELTIASSMVEEDDLISSLLYSIIWLYVILLAIILITNNILLKRIWKPFYSMLEHLKRFNLESPQPIPAPDTRVTEFRMLHESVTTLIDHATETFNNQKQFIENASHELQTPLAISINKLELLMETESRSEADVQEVTSVIRTLERLTKLNKTLLLLSKIENRQFQDRTLVNISDIIIRAVADLSDLADFKSVTVTIHREGNLVLDVNPELAVMLISNLLKNAIVHNEAEGIVNVVITSTAIAFENSGTPHPLDASQLFDRFYKVNASNTSTGLGLSIVKSIADYYGLILKYHFNGRHQFVVSVKPG